MQRFILYLREHRALTIGVASGLVILIVALVGYFVFRSDDAMIEPAVKKTETTKETKVARRLDGVLVNAPVANAQPIALMIENITQSRPQSGLEHARVVYEALAEGGITRFLAIFDNTETITQIGPIRSARSYYLDLAEEYGALYGHVGGSPQAMTELRNATHDLIDFDQFFNSQYYWRATDRSAPHNVYTSTDLLTFALRDLDLRDASGTFTPWTFAEEEAEEAERGSDAQEIAINYSTFSYKTRYMYDRAANVYKRFHSDDAHLMTGEVQIAPKNVVVQYVRTTVIDEGRLSMNLDEGGNALVFNNGDVVEGTWVKEEGRTRFLDENGDDVPLVPGQTWVEIVPTDRDVSYPKPNAAGEGA